MLYKLAVVCGRFQPLHDGHVILIKQALAMANRVGLFVGSCNNTGTPQNPFTFEERYAFIDKIFHDEISSGRLIIKPLNDREHPSDDLSWGKYYIDRIHENFGTPDLFVSGNDKVRSQWFTEDDLKGIDELVLNRSTIKVSATDIRKNIDDIDFFKAWMPKELWSIQDAIKDKIKEVNENGK